MIVICSMRLPRAAPAQLDDCRSPSADVMKPRWDEHQDIVQAVPSVERRSFLFASLCPRREEPPVTGLDHDPLPLLVHSQPTRSEMAVARDSDPSRLAALLVVATPRFVRVHRQPPRLTGPQLARLRLAPSWKSGRTRTSSNVRISASGDIQIRYVWRAVGDHNLAFLDHAIR